MPTAPAFDYDRAFSRNVGWITADEQRLLAGKRIAIAGLGGVGGIHLLTLARLGVGRFSLAEMDVFELANFNRQAGALCSTIGRPKLEVVRDMARDINPDLEIREFPTGISTANIDDFLADVDVYVDSLDFFAFPAREAVYAACRRRGIPAICAAPLGMSTALLCFDPRGMSFEEYFRLAGHDAFEQ
ncbi:MAG: ThiF family adenylyltransferase, partial [Flavobacteriaceae bacterium]|nr:ThiF family adenylyltransferase [Flavobacteriaceae bacterium]